MNDKETDKLRNAENERDRALDKLEAIEKLVRGDGTEVMHLFGMQSSADYGKLLRKILKIIEQEDKWWEHLRD